MTEPPALVVLAPADGAETLAAVLRGRYGREDDVLTAGSGADGVAPLPGTTGGNPSLTSTAVAERGIEIAVRRITGDPAWPAPERADVVRGDVPEDAAVQNVRVRGPRRPAPRGVRFAETMTGAVRLPPAADPATPSRRAVLRLDVRIPDLQALVELTGTVSVAGLTARPAAVTGGKLHLLATVDGGQDRTMTYLLPFTDDAGRPCQLQGAKQVRRRRNTDPWRATTRLHVAVTGPDERHDGTVPTGRVTIGVPDVVRCCPRCAPPVRHPAGTGSRQWCGSARSSPARWDARSSAGADLAQVVPAARARRVGRWSTGSPARARAPRRIARPDPCAIDVLRCLQARAPVPSPQQISGAA